MISFVVKLITVPLVLFIAMYASNQVNYTAVWQPIIISLLLIGTGLAMEYLILNKETLWISVALDFITSLAVIYIVSNLFAFASVSFIGALTLSIILGICEYILHRFLIQSNNVKKAAT
ncbi:DUF2512 family protein [Gracilibacillus sp. YIM 98692]|uniref:DUF2512 family protein n=1 Tax=Gracilibacillus sp. YIM 98692 TaxID=2663532 RepID=UPI0013D261FD|nr:DUF2512 family protein [Gracilibacillus sp. YIM 98692]